MSLQYAVSPSTDEPSGPFDHAFLPQRRSALVVRLFGPLEIRCFEDRDLRPAAHKAQELFCYLLLRRGSTVRRDKLSDALWAEGDPERCRKNLRQALWQLQSAFGRATATNLLQVTNTTVTFRDEADLWVDLIQFRSVFESVSDTPGLQFTAPIAQRVHDTVRLYRGELLEDFDFDWCLVEREWIRSAYISLLDKLMTYSEAKHHYELGIAYGERILRLDPAREYTHRNLMYLHYLRGDRTGAIRQYARCIQSLQEELAIRPADTTAHLSELIRADADVVHIADCHVRGRRVR